MHPISEWVLRKVVEADSKGVEAGAPHGEGDFRVAGEGVPDEAGAEVFGHEEADAEIDAEDVGVVVVGLGMEGVAEAVAAAGFVAVVGFERALDAQAGFGEEGERAGRGVGDYGAVDAAEAAACAVGASPGGVAVGGVGGADAPVVGGVGLAEGETEGFVGAGGGDGVGEVVGVAVALVAEVVPGVAVLVGEEGVVAADVGEAVVGDGLALPGIPAGGRDGVGGRADGQQVDHHELAEVAPACAKKTILGMPAHGEGGSTVEHPGPVDAVVDEGGELVDLGVVVKVRAGGENAAEEQRGVDGGDFYVLCADAGVDVVEVVEEAVDAGQGVRVEVQRAADLLDDFGARLVAAVVGDAESGEAEAGAGDGGHGAGIELAIGVVGGGAVEDLAGGGAGLLDEVEAGAALHVVEEELVGVGEGVGGRLLGG